MSKSKKKKLNQFNEPKRKQTQSIQQMKVLAKLLVSYKKHLPEIFYKNLIFDFF